MTKRAALASLLLAGLAGLAGLPARADEPTPVGVSVGRTFDVCAAKLLVCPVSSFLCDDPKIAVMEFGPAGAVVKGVAPGTTLCSARGHDGAFRVVMRVTVTR